MEVTCTGVNGGVSEIVAVAGSGSTAVGDSAEALRDHVGTIVDGVDGVSDVLAQLGLKALALAWPEADFVKGQPRQTQDL